MCGPAPRCEDDPTFLSLGSFSCGTTSPDICDIDAENAGPACGVRLTEKWSGMGIRWSVGGPVDVEGKEMMYTGDVGEGVSVE